MKEILFDILYAGGLLAGSPWFLYKMATTGKYRSGLGEKLGFVEPRMGDGDSIWVHGVSVGELLAARGLVSALEGELQGVEIIISTTTNTGYAVAKKTYPGRRVFYYPLDFSCAVGRAFGRLRPRMVVLMELEVWPNFLSRAGRLGIPVVVANGRITQRSMGRLRRVPRFARGLLSGVTLYLMQNEEYRRRIIELGVPAERVEAGGNLKFDNLSTQADPERAQRLRREMGIGDGERLIIGGSTHAGEEKALLDAYRRLRGEGAPVRLLVVPRHKERFEEVAALIEAEGFALLRRSRLAEAAAAGEEVIVGDTMGELEGLYEAADVAFVGGSLIPHGGQNFAEPAAKGKPVVAGPSIHNFPDAYELLSAAGAITRVGGAGELAGALAAYLDPATASAAGEAGRSAVASARGAAAGMARRIKDVYEGHAEKP